MKWVIGLLVLFAGCANVKKASTATVSNTDSLVSRFDSSLKLTITRTNTIAVVAADSLTSSLHLMQDSTTTTDSVITSYTESGSLSIKLRYNRRTQLVEASATRKQQHIPVNTEKVEIEKKYSGEQKRVNNTTTTTTTAKEKQTPLKELKAVLQQIIVIVGLVAAFIFLLYWMRKKK